MTDRDRLILQQIADGYEYEEIAVNLGMKWGTLKNRAVKLFSRLGAYNRAHAVAEAMRKGIIR